MGRLKSGSFWKKASPVKTPEKMAQAEGTACANVLQPADQGEEAEKAAGG